METGFQVTEYTPKYLIPSDIDHINQLPPEMLENIFSFLPTYDLSVVIPQVCMNFRAVRPISDILSTCINLLKANSKYAKKIDFLEKLIRSNGHLFPQLIEAIPNFKYNLDSSDVSIWKTINHADSDAQIKVFSQRKTGNYSGVVEATWNPKTLQVNISEKKAEYGDYRTNFYIAGTQSSTHENSFNESVILRMVKPKNLYIHGTKLTKLGFFRWKKIPYESDEQKFVARSLNPLMDCLLKGYVRHIAKINLEKITDTFKTLEDFRKETKFHYNKFGLIKIKHESEEQSPSSFSLQLNEIKPKDSKNCRFLLWNTECYSKRPTIKELIQWSVSSKTTKMLNKHFGTHWHYSVH